MTDIFRDVDIAVVGAGTAGAAAALLAAQRGFEVVCLERRGLDDAGARWVNGVPGASFERAGIARPQPPERLAAGVDFHLVAGFGPERVTIRDHDLMEVDMRRLVARLQREAAAAGAELIGDTRVEGVDAEGLHTSRGLVKARWYVDASGLTGARLLGVPRPEPSDICAAAQQVHRITDERAARDFFAAHRAQLGETLCFAGIAGGYSILNVRADDGHVSILTGSIPAEGYRSGKKILEDFVAEHDWVGERDFGGARAIPIGEPDATLHRGPVVAIGDAASQVFAAHGSGIGAGMIAARLLIDALSDGRGPAGYQRDWHSEFGGLFAAYATFRRFSQTLDAEDLTRLMRSGLMDAELAAQGLEQRMPRPDPALLAAKLRAAMRAPDLAMRMAPVVAKMTAQYLRYSVGGWG